MFLSMAKPEEVAKYLEDLETHREEIENQIMDIVYFMPGIEWGVGWSLSPKQRKKIVEFIVKAKKVENGVSEDQM